MRVAGYRERQQRILRTKEYWFVEIKAQIKDPEIYYRPWKKRRF